MQEVFSRIAHASMSPLPVLLTGATGTGKTLCGSIIHRHSERRDGPFITLHCSALPEQLLESELFGHERNAFTGANTQRIGHVERANGGTLLLDEIADIPLSVQAKLLRFVEEKVFHRVGGREDIQVDLRLIAATHHDLQEEVSAGRFREDLYYRLRVLTIKMPALNERLDDLDALCSFFLAGADPEQPHVLSPESHDLLMRYPWPGNIRELRNALEHAVAICGSHTAILPRHLPDEIRTLRGYHDHVSEKLRQQLEKWVDARMESEPAYRDLHDELENMLIRKLLAVFDGKSTALAEALQMNRATLLKKRKRLEE
jgi:DNA-binding NtrC family response regulator